MIANLKILNNQEVEAMNVFNKKDTQRVLLKIIGSSQTIWVDCKYLKLNQGLQHEDIHS